MKLKQVDIDFIKSHALDGLVTDGGHHKQWYLEQIMKIVCDEDEYERIKNFYDWEKGIAP